jgi:hypothetical protein
MAACCTSALGREPGFAEYRAVQDSFGHLPPNMRFYTMRKAGLLPPPARIADDDSGSGIRLVGKWGGGPSVRVTGRDSLVFLSRGSEVVAINFADTANPRVLSYIQAQGLVSRSVLVGNRLYVGSTGSDPKYIEVFDVTDPTNAVKLGSVQTMLNDIAVSDTLVYTISDDSFKVFNFADPASPTLVGSCRDSGYTISVNNGHAYLGDRWGMYVVDATNPASPHRVASWGSYVISVVARNTICCVTTGNPNQPDELTFTILDVAVPSLPHSIGGLSNVGAYDMYLEDTLAFLSGYDLAPHDFRILSISDSTAPRVIGTCATPDDKNGVWAAPARQRAYVADYDAGLTVVNIANPAAPALDSVMLLRADMAVDVSVQGGFAYVADNTAGLKVLDLTNASLPTEVGFIDSTSRNTSSPAVAAMDSFVCAGWWPQPKFRTFNVAEPTMPSYAGGCTTFDQPQDIVIRDTLAYMAERLRFQVFNVARPRAPVLVGSCVLPSDVTDLDLEDSLAFVTTLPFSIVNVSRPNSPVLVGSSNVDASGVDAVDTIAYITAPYTGLVALNVARPAQPMTIDSLYLPNWWNDVVVVGSRAYVGGTYIKVVDISDPTDLRVIGSWTPPYLVRRLCYSAPYLYAACYDAGVCVLESTAVGVSETPTRELADHNMILTPSLTSGRLDVSLSITVATGGTWIVRDVAGRLIRSGRVAAGQSRFTVDLTSEPAGVYMVELELTRHGYRGRVVKL